MSQSPDSADTQALVQSMLQRLKIQQGKDSETQQQLHELNPTVSTCAEEAEASSVQKLHTVPVDGSEFVTNRIHSNVLRISDTDQSTRLKGETVQTTVLNWEVEKDPILFPAQNNSDGQTGQNRAAGQDTQPWIPQAETGQLFTGTLTKDADVASNVETGNIGSGTVSSPEQSQSRAFQPEVFARSSKATYVTGSPQNRVSPVENGERGTFSPMHITATDQNIERGGFSRKQQSMGKKTRRWTQRIKERWKDRRGSFGKQQKEEQKAQQIGQQSEKLLSTTTTNTSHKEEESVASSPDPIEPTLTHTEDTNNDGNTSDFEFSLGSFSLLEEITSGQEWARFLTPNWASASADQRTLQEAKAPTCSTQSLFPNHSSNNQRGFHDRVAPPFSDVGATQTWPGYLQPGDLRPVSMDVSEEQMESMEHGHAQAGMRIGRQSSPPSFPQPTDVQNNSSMKSRVQMTRKRHHHLTERMNKDPQIDEKPPDKEGFTSPWSSCEMAATGASHHDGDLPLYAYPPFSPSFFPSLAKQSKGVLKHPVSQDSESSLEILTKRRRVEENRHVHFSEEVVTIMPPELDLDSSDPEEDSREEEDSVQELEHEEEQVVFGEVAPARRPALSAWILSLKNRSSQRKHRK